MSGARFNPYAPPGMTSGVQPVPALPPGFGRFRLDPVRYRSFATRVVLRRLGRFAVACALFLALFNVVLRRSLFDGAVGLAWFVVAFLVVSLVTVFRSNANALLTYELVLGPRVLRRTSTRMIPAEILRPEVTRIVETRDGLWLSSDAPPRSLFVACAVDGYADVRAALATWQPIEAARGWAAWRVAARGAKRQGQRDAVLGTALASDASLGDELAYARSASSIAYLGSPRRPWRTLVLWVLLIVMFLAIWQFLSPAPRAPARPSSVPSTQG